MITHKLLERWQKAGLIQASQVEAIWTFESQRVSKWAAWGFALVGVWVVILGLVMLVSTYWNVISLETKLAVDVAGFVVLWAGLLGVTDERNRVSHWKIDALLLLMVGYLWATVVLLNNVFPFLFVQFGYQVAVWCVVALPFVLMVRRPVGGVVWWGMAWLGFLSEVSLSTPLALALCFSIPPFLLLLGDVLKKRGLVLSFAVGTHWGALMGMAGAWAGYRLLWGPSALGGVQSTPWQDMGALAAVCVGFLAVGWHVGRVETNRALKVVSWGILWVFALFECVQLAGLRFGLNLDLWVHVLALVAIGLAAVYASLIQNSRWFAILTFLAGLRFWWMMVDALQETPLAGGSLVVAGVLIVGLAFVWQRGWRKLDEAILRRYGPGV